MYLFLRCFFAFAFMMGVSQAALAEDENLCTDFKIKEEADKVKQNHISDTCPEPFESAVSYCNNLNLPISPPSTNTSSTEELLSLLEKLNRDETYVVNFGKECNSLISKARGACSKESEDHREFLKKLRRYTNDCTIAEVTRTIANYKSQVVATLRQIQDVTPDGGNNAPAPDPSQIVDNIMSQIPSMGSGDGGGDYVESGFSGGGESGAGQDGVTGDGTAGRSDVGGYSSNGGTPNNADSQLYRAPDTSTSSRLAVENEPSTVEGPVSGAAEPIATPAAEAAHQAYKIAAQQLPADTPPNQREALRAAYVDATGANASSGSTALAAMAQQDLQSSSIGNLGSNEERSSSFFDSFFDGGGTSSAQPSTAPPSEPQVVAAGTGGSYTPTGEKTADGKAIYTDDKGQQVVFDKTQTAMAPGAGGAATMNAAMTANAVAALTGTAPAATAPATSPANGAANAITAALEKGWGKVTAFKDELLGNEPNVTYVSTQNPDGTLSFYRANDPTKTPYVPDGRGGYTLAARGSESGTKINGRPVEEGKFNEERTESGTRILFPNSGSPSGKTATKSPASTKPGFDGLPDVTRKPSSIDMAGAPRPQTPEERAGEGMRWDPKTGDYRLKSGDRKVNGLSSYDSVTLEAPTPKAVPVETKGSVTTAATSLYQKYIRGWFN